LKTGTTNLPLHGGKAPAWLFQRMVKLGRAITECMVDEFGPDEMLRKVSDPYWFQALGCVLGFDWHSSGVTTTVCGALKEAVKPTQGALGLYVCGGKGAASRKTPMEIAAAGDAIGMDPTPLVYCSRMSAKVDSAAVQDGYQIYQHSFFFTSSGNWAVVQQGMNEQNRYARRYHWLGADTSDFTCDPHAAVCSLKIPQQLTLNLVAAEAAGNRNSAAMLLREFKPQKLALELHRLEHLDLPSRHQILMQDIDSRRITRILEKTYENVLPNNFEALLGTPGVGAKTLRALSLLAEVIYGEPASFRDPARFSFAHGGKDGIPYPVDRPNYDKSIATLKRAVRNARLGRTDQIDAFRRLARFDS
jgi:hypothetical protein